MRNKKEKKNVRTAKLTQKARKTSAPDIFDYCHEQHEISEKQKSFFALRAMKKKKMSQLNEKRRKVTTCVFRTIVTQTAELFSPGDVTAVIRESVCHLLSPSAESNALIGLLACARRAAMYKD